MTITADPWVKLSGDRPGRLVRDGFEVRTQSELRCRAKRGTPPPKPVVYVLCACGDKTVARTPQAQTISGWLVEWPETTTEGETLPGVCRKCARMTIASATQDQP